MANTTNHITAKTTHQTAATTHDRPVTVGGVNLHRGEVQRYRERNQVSFQRLEKMKPLIPTGHAGGMWYQLPYPVLLERGKGPRVWDVDGNEYLDMRIGDWVMALGHRNEAVREAIITQLEKASQLGCPEWDLSYRMAQVLSERMPSVERVRFLASGTETNLLALRLARAYTGRNKLAKAQGSYHGIADVLVVGDSSIAFANSGIPAGVTPGVAQDVIEFPFNDPDGAESVLEREAKNLAAVIVEPVMGAAGMVPATTEFLQRLRQVTERLGIVLIFDEVVTFPMHYGGAQAYHGVTPDLTSLSKSIGGGLPQAAIGGRAEIMDLLDPDLHEGRAPVLAASTFGGNVAALAAGLACLEQLTPEVHQHIQATGDQLREGIDGVGSRLGVPLHATGLGHLYGLQWAEERVVDYRTRMNSDGEKIANIMLGLLNEGVYQYSFGTLLIGASHGDAEIDEFLDKLERALHNVDLVP
jgi:glutamate-1-semialdehyde 2,1-aminomutase